ncbi:MAG: TOBE domain-containing protein, partial [Rhodospirillales bacterium]|nr:TOBE domain-containing protein [Rhodospirillales bacterium]
QVGPPHEIYEMPANRFVASFLGEANLLPLEATQGERARTAGGLELAVATSDAASGPEPTLCLRPENVRLGEAAAGLGNAWTATVLEAVHIAGSIRYRLQLPGGTVLLARAPARIGDPVWQAGATVVAGWRPADAVILLA